MHLNTIRRPTNFRHCSWVALGLGIVLGVGVAGCSKQPAHQANVPAEPPKSPEQESFDEIVGFMRNMLIDSDAARAGNVRFPANSNNPAIGGAEGVLSYELKLDASPEVIQPENAEEPVRGRIEVTMISSYSRIQQSAPEGTAKQQEHGSIRNSTIDDIIRDPDLQIEPLDAERILKESGAGRQSPKKPTGTIVLEPRQETVVFDLEYVDGKWRLAHTEFNKNISSAIKTLETALERQR